MPKGGSLSESWRKASAATAHGGRKTGRSSSSRSSRFRRTSDGFGRTRRRWRAFAAGSRTPRRAAWSRSARSRNTQNRRS